MTIEKPTNKHVRYFKNLENIPYLTFSLYSFQEQKLGTHCVLFTGNHIMPNRTVSKENYSGKMMKYDIEREKIKEKTT